MKMKRKHGVKYLGRNIKFRKKYIKLILSGEKTTTIRKGIIKAREREVTVCSNGKPICRAEILNLQYKRLKDLTDEDAERDGFRDLLELLQELENIYGDIDPFDWFTIIKFRVKNGEEESR
ncbi:MAG: ASCH domain-containing protein [Candidatus Verstraetearchaeota archaeon]|nr:ASCH domain-containing protein [Candidatus Verstraetearchaeota archaeon]RLE57515.1 MAG: hypothetical protein DRJ30_00140 [Candidatus Verstraetearchaeota archaeon]